MRANQLSLGYEQHEQYLADESTYCSVIHPGSARVQPKELGGPCKISTTINYRTVCCGNRADVDSRSITISDSLASLFPHTHSLLQQDISPDSDLLMP